MSAPRLIAEWQPSQTCWLAWPSLREEWLGDLDAPRRAVAALARAIAGTPATATSDDAAAPTVATFDERVELLVQGQEGEHSARLLLGDTPVHIRRDIPFGDIWLRDTGPVFVARGQQLTAACFDWNGWGGKYLFDHDAQVAERIATAAGLPIERHAFVLEGGAIDSDGQGTLLTTRQCLLAGNRTPDRRPLPETMVEERLRHALGARRVIWLDRGLQNDHTDGHVDTLARFVAPGRVVCMRAHDKSDPNRAVLDQIAADLERERDAHGQPLEVVELPSPGRILGPPDDDLMPASYVNFYLGNRTVVVPTYGSPWDQRAVDTLAAVFPDRQTIGLDARAIITGGGAFHCISKEQPLPLMSEDRP